MLTGNELARGLYHDACHHVGWNGSINNGLLIGTHTSYHMIYDDGHVRDFEATLSMFDHVLCSAGGRVLALQLHVNIISAQRAVLALVLRASRREAT